jgi:hypothetical protein
MNNVSVVLLSVVACLYSVSPANAAGLVSFPTGDASWTVNVNASGSSKGAPTTYVQKAQVTQLNNVKRIELTWSDGKTTEKWSVPKLPVEFEEDPRDGRVNTFSNGSMHENLTKFFLTYDSFAFDWVNDSTLKEKSPISYQGKQCYHFLSSATAQDSGISFKREAWIDATTLLPVAFDNGVSLSTYTFSPRPPVGPLEFPPAFKTAIHYYKITMGYQ